MAYDERLAERVRDVMAVRSDAVEKKMFGGLGWMLRGNLAVCVTDTGGLIVRVEPDEVEVLIRDPGVSTFGREGAKPMKGFVLVDGDCLADAGLADWVNRGSDRALALPPK